MDAADGLILITNHVTRFKKDHTECACKRIAISQSPYCSNDDTRTKGFFFKCSDRFHSGARLQFGMKPENVGFFQTSTEDKEDVYNGRNNRKG